MTATFEKFFLAAILLAASLFAMTSSFLAKRSAFLEERWTSAELRRLHSEEPGRKLSASQLQRVASYLGTLRAEPYDPSASPSIVPEYWIRFESALQPQVSLNCYLGFYKEHSVLSWEVGERDYRVTLSLSERESLLRALESRWDQSSQSLIPDPPKN